MKKKRRRIHKSEKYLPFYIKESEEFFVGILYDDYIKSAQLKKYGLPETFSNNKTITPLAKGSVTKANLKGKYGRVQPEEKEIRKVHIRYFRRKDGRLIEFDRNFDVYAKMLLHKFNITLTQIVNAHGQKIIVSDKLIFDKNNNVKNTHVINLFCEIFNDFEILNKDLEPAIHFNVKFAQDLLPQGSLNDDSTVSKLLEFSNRYTKNETEQKAFQKRLHILQEYSPDIRGKGPSGFMGYIVFGFSDLNLVLLETMYSGNATYAFNLTDYEKIILTDKQTIIKEKSAIKRFYHYNNWEEQLTTFLKSRKK